MLKGIFQLARRSGALPIFSIAASALFVGATVLTNGIFMGCGAPPIDRIRAGEVAFLGTGAFVGLAAVVGLTILLRHLCLPRGATGGALWQACFSLALSIAVMIGFVMVYHRVFFQW